MIWKLFLISAMILPKLAFCYSGKHGFNLILGINGEIVVGSISDLQITCKSVDGDERIFHPVYFPGNLEINDQELAWLLSDKCISISLEFRHYGYTGKKQTTNHYQIKFDKKWFPQKYFILKIFHVRRNKMKNNKKASTIKDYRIQVISPDYSFIEVE